mmetsp:Transcript_28713/g.67329  ORF Transcript_28713/g.67329 Transcript_28713/m.67329 type:complete len:215 (-) Transcript_28713:260-904(-)
MAPLPPKDWGERTPSQLLLGLAPLGLALLLLARLLLRRRLRLAAALARVHRRSRRSARHRRRRRRAASPLVSRLRRFLLLRLLPRLLPLLRLTLHLCVEGDLPLVPVVHVLGLFLVTEQPRPCLVVLLGQREGESANRCEGPLRELGVDLLIEHEVEPELLRLLTADSRELKALVGEGDVLLVDVEHGDWPVDARGELDVEVEELGPLRPLEGA